MTRQRLVEGYVRARKRYLGRRVAAQREGHGRFTTEVAGVAGGGHGTGPGRPRKITEASKAEFRVGPSISFLSLEAANPCPTQLRN